MNFRQAITAIAFAAALSACGSKDLTQDQAKSLLNDYFQKNPMTQPFLTGMTPLGQSSEAEYFKTPGGKYQKELESDGLITITSKGKIVNPEKHGEWFNALDVNLTDKGKALVSGKPNVVPAAWKGTWPTVYENAAFCTRAVANIASVATSDDFSRVEYTWQVGNKTQFAIRSHEADPNEKTCEFSSPQSASATFELHDGVWQLTAAQ